MASQVAMGSFLSPANMGSITPQYTTVSGLAFAPKVEAARSVKGLVGTRREGTDRTA